MSIRFDGDGVEDAARHLARRADVARRLVASAAQLEGGLAERQLSLAVLALADLTGGTAELVALDLRLLGTRTATGARLMSAAEDSAALEAERRRGGPAGGWARE